MQYPNMHDSAKRLFKAAARKLQRESITPGELASFLGVSPQTVNNWIARGVSREGAMLGEKECGVSATFIREGVATYPKFVAEQPNEVRENMNFYWPFRQITPSQLRKLTLEELDQLESLMLQKVAHRLLSEGHKTSSTKTSERS